MLKIRELKMDNNLDDTKILKIISRKKIITIEELSSLLKSSVKTARRRLKVWGTYTSYNENGRYYTLLNTPKFDSNGLWVYRKVRFSKYGNLKQTIIHMIKQSRSGFNVLEMSDLLGISAHPFLTALQKHLDIKREKIQGRFVYFSAIEDDFIKQKDCRMDTVIRKQLPSGIEAILILVETIKNPNLSVEKLVLKLKSKNCNVTAESIRNLYNYHGLTIKKMPEVPF